MLWILSKMPHRGSSYEISQYKLETNIVDLIRNAFGGSSDEI